MLRYVYLFYDSIKGGYIMTDRDLKHYNELMQTIGIAQLLKVPNPYKEALKNETNLSNKIRILEFLLEHNIVKAKQR